MLVVLADPSRTVQKAVAHLLDLRGHGVCAFADGHEALAELRSNAAVDALITSTEPVGLSGFERCWQARLLASARRPIYVITHAGDPESVVRAVERSEGAPPPELSALSSPARHNRPQSATE